MAVVGDAYIVVKAITAGFETDVRRALNGIDIGSDGKSIGESFTKGFNNSIARGLGKKFDFSAQEAQAARLAFQTLVRTSFTLTAALGPLIAGLGSLGGGFVSLVSILGAATPALVVLPGIFTAIGLAAITTIAALGGVGKAVSAGLAQQKKATQDNTAAKIAAARRIEDIEKRIQKLSEDGLRIERDRVKDSIEAAADEAKAIEEANADEAEAYAKLTSVKEKNTESMIEANNRLKDAQLELTKALEDGREEIQQIGFDAEDAALSEKRASITLEKARETLQRTQDLPPNSRARREAQLAFAEAELGLRRAKDKNKDLQKQQDKLGGDPKSTAGYINALERQEDAQANVAQTARDALRSQQAAEVNITTVKLANIEKILAAEQKIADVKQRYQDREEDIGRQIQDAYDDLTRAMEDQAKAAEGITAGVDAYANALDGLSPAAEKFVKYLVGTFIPELKKLRDAAAEALLPLIEGGLEKLRTKLFDPLKPMLAGLATSIGTAFNSIIDSIVKPDNIKDLEKVFDQSGYVIEGLGKTIGSVYDSILSILVAADPLIRKFTDFLATKTADFAKFLNTAQASGDLQAFFDKAGDIAARLGGIFGNMFSGISNVIGANFEPGGGGYIVLNWLEKITAKFEAFSGSVEGKDSLAAYFKGAATNAISILESVGAFVKEILKVGADPNVKVFFDTLKGGAPVFGDILTSAVQAGPSLAELVVNILKFTKATTDAGAIKIFFDTLNTVLGAINTLLENKFIKNVLDATGKVIAFGLALGTIGKVGKFGTQVIAGSLENIGAVVRAIVPNPILAKVTSGLDTIKLRGMYAFDKIKAGAISAGKAIGGQALKGVQAFARGSMILLTSPIFWMAIAIVAIIASLVLLYNKVDWFKEGVDKAFKAVKGFFMDAFDWLKENWPLVLAILTGPIGLAVLAISKNWDEIVAFVKAVPGRIAEIASKIWSWISDKFQDAYDSVKAKWDVMLAWVKGLPEQLKNNVAAMWNWISDKFQGAYDSVKAKWDAMLTWVKTLPGKIASAAAGLWDGFRNGFKDALNYIINKWNNFRIEAKFPDDFFLAPLRGKGFVFDTPNIPPLAQGGIVPATPGGTIARIGEAGRAERVEPLDPDGLSKRDRAMIQLLAGSSSSAGNTINVYPSQGMNESELASIISRQIAFQLRRGGA